VNEVKFYVHNNYMNMEPLQARDLHDYCRAIS